MMSFSTVASSPPTKRENNCWCKEPVLSQAQRSWDLSCGFQQANRSETKHPIYGGTFPSDAIGRNDNRTRSWLLQFA